MNNSLLTVLMPVFNAEKYLQEAIDSILQQTFPYFEFLIIDDGSTDSSIDIINSNTDPRIRLVKNVTNLGISATLNKGIELSSNELIARMDADDISYPERLQKQYDFFNEHPDCALLSTAARTITRDKEPVSIDDFKSPYFFYNLIFECWIYHPTVMYRRSIVQQEGGYSTPWSEDFELWWHISRNYKIWHLTDVLLDYRLTEESICRVAKKEEYEKSQHQQMLRNIHYYTGHKMQLTNNEIQCLRHNFEPIISENNLTSLINCINKLEYINHCIFQKERINEDFSSIKEAALNKKKFIMDNICKTLSPTEIFLLLIRTGNLKKLYSKQWKKGYKSH